MTISITGRQRKLVYEYVTDRLTGIDAVWRNVAANEWEDAQRCSREFADFLLLLAGGLGWGTACGEPVTLAVGSDVLRRALEAIRVDAACENREQRELRLLVAETQVERQETLDACDELLARLDD